MTSAFSQPINDIKYADLFAKLSTWATTKDVWVKNGGVWVEPQEVYANSAGTWTRVTHPIRFLKFNGSAYLACGTYFNNYTASATASHEFRVIFTTFASTQTLFSYGGAEANCTIEIGTDGKVYVQTHYNQYGPYQLAHASALSLNTIYTIYVITTNDATPSLTISVHDANGSQVGSDVSTGVFSRTSNTAVKYIGQRHDGANKFTGYLLDIHMYGGTYGGADQAFDANDLLSSTVGSATIVDSNNPQQNLTGTSIAVQVTG
jgi:hypothetical protein